MLGAELVRVQSKKPPQDGLDTTRYAMLAPTGEGAHSVSSWQRAHDNSLAQLEHQRLRSLNVTLLSGTLGANAWKVNNFDLKNSVKRVEGELEETRRGTNIIHRLLRFNRCSERLGFLPSPTQTLPGFAFNCHQFRFFLLAAWKPVTDGSLPMLPSVSAPQNHPV
ncbi:hypothetical protein T439DRAFT_130175 [Meredithblackwellia eburnea MCA 4105]